MSQHIIAVFCLQSMNRIISVFNNGTSCIDGVCDMNMFNITRLKSDDGQYSYIAKNIRDMVYAVL